MHNILLHFHSGWRWLVLVTAVWAIARAIGGVNNKTPYTGADRKAGKLFVMSMHIQALVGIVMYFAFSPYFSMLTENFGETMKISPYRFFAIEHTLGMLTAVILVTVGNAKVKRAADDHSRHKKALIYFSIALVIMLATIPWPFMEKFAGRGWF